MHLRDLCKKCNKKKFPSKIWAMAFNNAMFAIHATDRQEPYQCPHDANLWHLRNVKKNRLRMKRYFYGPRHRLRTRMATALEAYLERRLSEDNNDINPSTQREEG